MSEEKSDIQDIVQNELKRVQILNHSNFPAWHSALKHSARQVIDLILDRDVTSELILLAQDAREAEREEYRFLRVIGDGDPNPVDHAALTQVCLEEILVNVEMFA